MNTILEEKLERVLDSSRKNTDTYLNGVQVLPSGVPTEMNFIFGRPQLEFKRAAASQLGTEVDELFQQLASNPENPYLLQDVLQQAGKALSAIPNRVKIQPTPSFTAVDKELSEQAKHAGDLQNHNKPKQ